MVRLEQRINRGEDLLLKDNLRAGVGMNSIGLHQHGHIPYTFQEFLYEDYTQVFGYSRIAPLKPFRELLPIVGRHLHTQKNGYSACLSANEHNLAKISIHFRKTDSTKPVIPSQFDNHDIRSILFNQSGKPDQPSRRRITRNASIHDLVSVFGEGACKKSNPALRNVRQSIARTDTVTENQER